ncbi:MAG: hypothetical protein PVSMB7_21780 [Chloroflexota bacterium]
MKRRNRTHLWTSGLLAIALALWTLVPGTRPVGAAGATLKASQTYVAAGDAISATGNGFHPGDTAVVTADFVVAGTARRSQSAAHVQTNGAFSAPVTIPQGAAPGLYWLQAKDFHGAAAQTVVRVVQVLSMSVGGKEQGATVISGLQFFAEGAGFAPGEKVGLAATFPLYSGATYPVHTIVVADSSGRFRTGLQVPGGAKQGGVRLFATGQTSKKSASGVVGVVYRPSITLSAAAVRPGAGATVTGQGFVPGGSVRIATTFARNGAPTTTVSQTVAANQYGQISAQIALPSDARPGSDTVTATDVTGGFRAAATFVVSVKPTIALVNPSILPGESVQIKGSGYSAHVAVTVSAGFPLYGGGSRAVTTSVTTDAQGNFSLAFATPGYAAAGTVTLVAQGPNGRSSAQLAIRHIGATIAVAPGSVVPGSAVNVRGSGYRAGVSVNVSVTVTLTNGTKQTLSVPVSTNRQGQFLTTLHIPATAASGSYTVLGRSLTSGRAPGALLSVARLNPTISIAPSSAVPGSAVTVHGVGYVSGNPIHLTVEVTLTNGGKQTIAADTMTNGQGQFMATLRIPAAAVGGLYTVIARNTVTGRSPAAQLRIATLAPSIVASPTTGVPGTQATVNGFGFAGGQTISLFFQGQKAGTATTNAAGQFTAKITIPANAATATYTVSAQSSGGRKAQVALGVARQVSTHFYFASFYTGQGYTERIAFLNPSAIQARVQITYQMTSGASKAKTIVIPAHTRFTEDVNADLGVHVSAGASVSADVPLVAERIVFHGSDMSGGPAATRPSSVWYFANGNTGHHYREFLAIQNPNSGPVRVAIHFLPTHHRAFTVYRTMPATSRTTVKVNTYVRRDAVGVIVTSNGPVVVNRSIFIHHGITSKIGVTAPQPTWYFASGPANQNAHHWIGAINPSNKRTYVTVRTYGPLGADLGSVHAWLKPFARVGFLINRVAHSTDAAVVLTASNPVIAEQTTYAGRMHDASTDTFGVPAAARSWGFAAVNTLNARGDSAVLNLFNPSLTAIPVVVQFMTTSGQIVQRTYVVAPLAHQRVDVGSVVPNAQLGIVASSDYPFIAMNRDYTNNHLGSLTSMGSSL